MGRNERGKRSEKMGKKTKGVGLKVECKPVSFYEFMIKLVMRLKMSKVYIKEFSTQHSTA